MDALTTELYASLAVIGATVVIVAILVGMVISKSRQGPNE